MYVLAVSKLSKKETTNVTKTPRAFCLSTVIVERLENYRFNAVGRRTGHGRIFLLGEYVVPGQVVRRS